MLLPEKKVRSCFMSIRECIERSSKPRSGIAIGGIGTGTLELRKDGIFRNWSIFNNEPVFGGPRYNWPEDSTFFFLVRYQEEGKHPKMKLLQIDEGDHPAGALLQFYTFPWMSGVDRIDYEASFPVTRLRFSDEEMPFTIELEALSPFIPGDVKNSAIPGAYFRFRVESKTDKRVDVLLMANMRHVAGYDIASRAYAGTIEQNDEAVMIEHHCENMDPEHPTWGQMVLASLDKESTYHAGWSHRHTFHEPLLHMSKLPNLDQVADQNAVNEELGTKVATHECISTIGRDFVLTGQNKTVEHDFVLSWYFPNCYADMTAKQKSKGETAENRREGHYYENHFTDAISVANYLIAQRNDLVERSLAFLNAFNDSTLPEVIRDQINVHLNTFTASSWFTKDGNFGIQEGWTSDKSWGPLATIDVGMYGSVPQAFLFPQLDRAMLEVHHRLQFASGDVVHGIGRNFSTGDANEHVKGRLDLAPQYVLMMLRHCFANNDETYLRSVWPSVCKALDYTLTQRDSDNDSLPEMEGTMSTYDNFPMWGPASLIVSQWIAALSHGVTAARRLGDNESAEKYQAILGKAGKRFVETLWNGKYFSLFNDIDGDHGRDEGCLTDQIIGQWAQLQVGLEDICEHDKITTALHSIIERNMEPGEGIYNCRWPEDKWLHPVPDSCWFDQANTYWTGVELAFASFLIYEGMVKEGFDLVEAVDRRYRKAGRAWDHQEWGGHYYRGMSAWAVVNAALGFSACNGRYTFAPKVGDNECKLFFAINGAYGHFERSGQKIRISLASGALAVHELHLGVDAKKATTDAGTADVRRDNGKLVLEFDNPVQLETGKAIEITLG